jgi:hypothetical protein
MIVKTNLESAFAILSERRRALPDMLERAFGHRWVASYQVGFGPPLVRSSDRIIDRVKESRSALEKLRAYFEVCILDEPERQRLAALHRKLLVRQHGPIEAEILDAASSAALDLTLRLHIPTVAPPAVAESMKEAGVDFAAIPAETPPEIMSARFLVRLHDPYNSRLLHRSDIEEQVGDAESAVALEMRVPVALRPLYAAWLAKLTEGSEYGFVDLVAPVSHARISRNGERA